MDTFRLPEEARIPEKDESVRFGSGAETLSTQPYVASPHLANPEQVRDFEKRIIEDTTDSQRMIQQQATSPR